jgi:hypothetical protein
MLTRTVHPVMEKGQWWATRNPLVLYRVVSAGSGSVVFKTWHPIEGLGDSVWIEPLDDNWIYLWFSGVVSVDHFQDPPLRTGDTFWSPQTREVFLIGDVTGDGVTILSDEVVPIHPGDRFQRLTRGPVDPATEPPSVYERILEQ